MAGLLPASNLSLPDGRLRVGTEVPLLARRYRYLSLLGEGRSAQVSSSQLQQCHNRTHQHKVPTANGHICIASRLGTYCSCAHGNLVQNGIVFDPGHLSRGYSGTYRKAGSHQGAEATVQCRRAEGIHKACTCTGPCVVGPCYHLL